MRPLVPVAGAVALAFVIAGVPPAGASHWPFAGGDASRSGMQGADDGSEPVTPAWAKGDPGVRTPVIITGGAGPSVQRVAYGTADGRVHIRVLATGARVGPEPPPNVDGPIRVDGDPTFGAEGSAGSVGFADTSIEDRLGQLIVVHNDEGQIAIARIDLATAAYDPASEYAVPGTIGCEIASSPVLTPPNDKGGRVLFFTIHGTPSCPANNSLVRLPIDGDALQPGAPWGEVTYAPVSGTENLTPAASPALVVLADPATGRSRFFVAVARANGVSFFPADAPLSPGSPVPAAVAPAITAALEAGEVAQTVVAPASAAGRVAGAEGSGTPRAPALYVAAAAAVTGSPGVSETKVYRFVQDGNAAVLRAAPAPARLPDGSGAPAPALAVSEVIGTAGAAGSGRLVVATEGNVYVLATDTLTGVGRPLSNAPLGDGDGFTRTWPALASDLIFAQRDGAADRAPQHLVRPLPDLQAAVDFSPAGGNGPGLAYGQPALSRGYAAYGSPAGVFVYRSRDGVAPVVDLLSPPASTAQKGTVTIAAQARDVRGIESVAFKVRSLRGTATSIGVAIEAETGSAWDPEGGRFAIPLQTESLRNGEYDLEATATAGSGQTRTAKRRLRIDNGANALRKGACAVTKTGTRKADRLTGTARGDRLLGGPGSDTLRGGRGDDCLLGQQGNDRLDGGAGADLLDGGPGSDRLSGGSGDDRVQARDRRRDTIRCGAGSDRVTADRSDRVSRDCERVTRPR